MSRRAPEEMLQLAEEGVRIARSLGADAAEVYLTRSNSITVNVTGEYALPREGRDQGVGLRVAVGERLGISGSSGASPAVLARVARHALDAARRVPESTRFRRFPAPSSQPIRRAAIDPALERADPERVAADVSRAADRLHAAKDVTYSGVTLNSWRHTFVVANSEGLLAWDENAAERLAVEARVSRGTTDRSSQEMAYARTAISREVDVEGLVDAALARARSALESERLARPVDEVLLAPGPAAQLVQLFTPALSGKRIRARQSPLAGRAGEAVASEALTIRDAPHGPHGVQQQGVDHEGTPTAPRPLLADGRLASFLYDSLTAFEEGIEPTGNGLRTGVTGGVAIRPVSLDVQAGTERFGDLVASAERAVLVDEPLMGSFVANETTGDVSLVAPFAFLVEHGKVRHALPPTTLGGNVHRALREVRGIARERRTFQSGIFPGMRLGGISCAT